ncbi:MAG: putative cysteine-rich PDZ-binding protein [Streblomastix strix]|uniref:Cysteine-rich PDZ-binding protein n=1 Tax=Streblomastix strix TaxID=222440 RepID=A0A5J4WJF2_9EUKA|nr:MAG: putative cysteine-rich PDZ-binding protein [Streblomastix strix]
MVCEQCEKKVQKLSTGELWKEGSRNVIGRGRNIGGDARFTRRFTPFSKKCIICKAQLSQDAKYCARCAHSKGVCAICGKLMEDRSLKGSRYKQ